MSLRKAAISGLLWTISQQFSVQIINFIVQIILARILLPEEFGLIGMMTVFMAIGMSLADSGMASSLIRTENPTQTDYSTVFFTNIAVSVFVYIIIYSTAGFVADFYHQPNLSNILRVYTLSFIIRAFSTVQTTRLTKEMNFKLQMKIQIPSVIISGIAGIVFAFAGYGVWSLVWMNLLQSLLLTIQYWIRSKWIPNWIFDRERLKYHFNFGYKLTVSSLLNTLFTNIYVIVIGKFFTPTILGYYTRAQTMQMFPVQNIATALNKVTYPMFASIQNDDVKLKSAYKKLMEQVLFWLAPLMIILIVTATPLFRFVLTDKWLPAVPYFQLLCISGILFPLQSYNLNILNVKGRSDLFLKIELIKKLLTIAGVCCIVFFGIYGLLFFRVASSFISFFVNSQYSGRMINFSSLEQLKSVVPIIILASLIGCLVWGIDYYFLGRGIDIVRILCCGILYFIIYLTISYLLKIPALKEFKFVILNNLKK